MDRVNKNIQLPSILFILSSIIMFTNSRYTINWEIGLLNLSYLFNKNVNLILVNYLVIFTYFLLSIPSLIASYLIYKYNNFSIKIGVIFSIITFIMFYNNRNYFYLLVSLLNLSSAIIGFNIIKNYGGKKNNSVDFEYIATRIFGLAGFFCIIILGTIIGYIFLRGHEFITWEFLTQPYTSHFNVAHILAGNREGQIGGIAHHMIGSMFIVTFTMLIAAPVGVSAAIYLAEYSSQTFLIEIIRRFIETLAGIPSVLLGLVGYGYFVVELGWGQSLAATSITLSFMVLPWIIRVCEEAILAIPQAYREASYALGATKWETIRYAVLGPAMPGITTGVILGIGKAFGESAIIMMTLSSNVSSLGNIALFKTPIPTITIWLTSGFLQLWRPDTPETLYLGQNLCFAACTVLLSSFLFITTLAMLIRVRFSKKYGAEG